MPCYASCALAWGTAWGRRQRERHQTENATDRAARLHLTNAQNQGIMKIETRLEAADSGD